jgi:hypothetical protein
MDCHAAVAQPKDRMGTCKRQLVPLLRRLWRPFPPARLRGALPCRPQLLLLGCSNHEMELQLDGSMFKSWLSRYGNSLPYA